MIASDRGDSPGPGSQGDDTLAETGPGIADDAVLEGELRPGELGAGADTSLRKLRASGWAGQAAATEDAEGEAQAHPS